MANIAKIDPFTELRQLQKQIFGDEWFTNLPDDASMRMPTTDVYMEGDKMMIVEAHLPQYNEKDITVDIDNGVLEIQGEKHEKVEDKGRKYMVRESSSSFYRRVRLPDEADASNIKADFDKGVLRVEVPFKKLPAPKKVHVNSSHGAKNMRKKK